MLCSKSTVLFTSMKSFFSSLEGKGKKSESFVCNFISSGFHYFYFFTQQGKSMLSVKITLHSFAVLWKLSLKIKCNQFTVTNSSSIKGCLCQPHSHWVSTLFFWQHSYNYSKFLIFIRIFLWVASFELSCKNSISA